MNQTLNVLLVDDSEDDAWMILRGFEKHGLRVDSERVQSSGALNEAMGRRKWDIVLSDYRMPRFSGLTALAIVRTHAPAMPFILLSSAIEEQTVHVALMTGATAFVAKDNLEKLVSTVKRELGWAPASLPQ